jgi:hypothetical protein
VVTRGIIGPLRSDIVTARTRLPWFGP